LHKCHVILLSEVNFLKKKSQRSCAPVSRPRTQYTNLPCSTGPDPHCVSPLLSPRNNSFQFFSPASVLWVHDWFPDIIGPAVDSPILLTLVSSNRRPTSCGTVPVAHFSLAITLDTIVEIYARSSSLSHHRTLGSHTASPQMIHGQTPLLSASLRVFAICVLPHQLWLFSSPRGAGRLPGLLDVVVRLVHL